MGYLGNPALVIAAQDNFPVANYQYPQDPTISINPKKLPCSWLNTISGEMWICTDNTTGANIWKCVNPSGHTTGVFSVTQAFTANTWGDIDIASIQADDLGIVSGNSLVFPKEITLISLSAFIYFSGARNGPRSGLTFLAHTPPSNVLAQLLESDADGRVQSIGITMAGMVTPSPSPEYYTFHILLDANVTLDGGQFCHFTVKALEKIIQP